MKTKTKRELGYTIGAILAAMVLFAGFFMVYQIGFDQGAAFTREACNSFMHSRGLFP